MQANNLAQPDVLAAFRMAQQHIALCAPDATVEQALNRAADNIEAMAGALRRLAVHVRPTCGELYREADEILSRYHGSVAPAGDGIGPGGTVDTDDDLPGMWERADFEGGATDAQPAAPAGGDDELQELPACWTYQHPERLYTADQMRAIRDAGIEYGRRIASAGSAPAPSAVTDGFALVPVEPTQQMLDAAKKAWTAGVSHDGANAERYRAMLAAAPTPEQQR